MVQIQRYLQKNIPQSDSPLPYLNSLFVNTFNLSAEIGEKPSFSSFIRYARKSPQIMAFLDILISDIISDTIKFVPINRSASGRNNIKRAQEFFDSNQGMEVLQETLRDMLLLGIGYNWTGKIDESKVKELCYDVAKKHFEVKELEFKAEQIYEASTPSMIKKWRCIPASTVSILHNDVEVTKYVQRVGVNIKEFSPKEVVTFKLMPFNGEVYPYCPMESLLADVYLLWLISQNYVSFFENGGHPDKVFILPKEIANSKNHSYLVETLQKYKKIQNKHGNLVFTGDIKVEDLMKVESQMEHQDLALYVTGVLALFYKVPAGRIPFLIGKAANNGDAGGLADAGYWRQISVMQSKIESALNNAIFTKYFGLTMEFGRGYKQDEVRETQIEMQKVQIAEQMINLGLWTQEYAGYKLEVPEEVLTQAMSEKEQRDEELRSGMLNQNMNNNKDVQQEPDKKLKNSVKQNTQNNNKNNNGKTITP
jgi:hypothetical protein